MPDSAARLLDQFAQTLETANEFAVSNVRAFAAWYAGSEKFDFVPGASDDVALRTYILHLRHSGHSRETVAGHLRSLKRFYGWARSQGIIRADPFHEFDLERPILAPAQVRRRRDRDLTSPDRELAHLRALNRLAQELNRSVDVRTILTVALEQVLDAMELKSGWAFLRADSDLASFIDDAPMHGYVLAAAVNLPPGLDQEQRFFLRKPPACHCQELLAAGLLTRAVNIVECSRLEACALASADTDQLLFHASVPLALREQDVGILNYATDEYQFLTAADLQLLSSVGVQVSAALERARLYDQAEIQRARLTVELEMARAVQASLLPETLPPIPGFSLATHWWFAREVGGDFCDVFALPQGRWAIVVGDVADKGAPAALYMAMTRALIRSRVDQGAGPGDWLGQVNHALCTQSTSSMFVTLFCAVIDPAGGSVTYANAGHNPPLLRRADGHLRELTRTGIALGIMDGREWTQEMLTLGRGDVVVAYTDGVTEAIDEKGSPYGADRLAAAVAQARTESHAILQDIVADLNAFVGGVPYADDITLFVVEKR